MRRLAWLLLIACASCRGPAVRRAQAPAGPPVEPAPAAAAQKAPAAVVFAAAGDIALSEVTLAKAESPLRGVQALLDAGDLRFANLEGALCDAPGPPKCRPADPGCFLFRLPARDVALVKRAHFELLSLANNHILDFGEGCRRQTERALDEAGILWSGRPGSVARFELYGLKFSLVAFHSAAHSNSTLDPAGAAERVRREARDGRLVLVSVHGGAEGAGALHTPRAAESFLGQPRGAVVEFAHRMVDAGADLVLGSGPHVVRAMEVYKDRLIAYSLGNLVGYAARAARDLQGIGLILEAGLEADGRFAGGRLLPIKLTASGLPVPDPAGASIDLVRRLSKEDFPATGVLVGADGSLEMPGFSGRP